MESSENNIAEDTLGLEKKILMVGFFDVLRFSARVEKEGVDKVYDDYQKLLKNVLDKPGIEVGGMIAPTFFGGDLIAWGGTVDVNYTYFSDTILLWLPLDPKYPTIFLQRCADLMCEALLMGIPLRGAIAIDEGYMHKKTGIYLGQAIVDAARLEAAQDQIGVGMTPSAALSILIPAAQPTQYIEYDIPIKKQSIERWAPLALDWPRRWRDCNYGDLTQYLRSMRPNDENVTKYYDNAIKFAEWSEAHNDWHNLDEISDFKHLRKVSAEEIANNPQLFPKQWLEVEALVRPVARL